MVPVGKFTSALRALNWVLIATRQLAYEKASHQEIASALDIAEYLPLLLTDERDRSESFRECLVDLSQRWPVFHRALTEFDS